MILKPEKDERFIDGIALYNSFGYPKPSIESTALDEGLPSDDAVAQTPAGSLSPVEEFNRAYERFLKMCRRK